MLSILAEQCRKTLPVSFVAHIMIGDRGVVIQQRDYDSAGRSAKVFDGQVSDKGGETRFFHQFTELEPAALDEKV